MVAQDNVCGDYFHRVVCKKSARTHNFAVSKREIVLADRGELWKQASLGYTTITGDGGWEDVGCESQGAEQITYHDIRCQLDSLGLWWLLYCRMPSNFSAPGTRSGSVPMAYVDI